MIIEHADAKVGEAWAVIKERSEIGDSKYYKIGHEVGEESIYKQYLR